MYIHAEKVYAFVRERHRDTGGYGATRLLPATIEDTYHAVGTLRILRALIPDLEIGPLLEDSDVEFLRQKWQAGEIDFRGAYQLWSLLSWAGIKPAQKVLNDFVQANLYRLNNLEAFCYAALLCNLSGLPLPFSARDISPLSPSPVVKELRYWLVLQGQVFRKRIPQKWVSWLKACQNGDGGFGFRPGTTSFVENTHYALEGLSILKASPRDKGAVEAFLQACQKPGGGFSRRPGAAPFLDATWHALAALALLTKS